MVKSSWVLTAVIYILLTLMVSSCLGGQQGGNSIPVVNGDNADITCPEPASLNKITSGQVRLYLPHNSVPAEILKCFNLKFGVDVVIDEFDDYEQMFAGVSASGKRYDLVLSRDMFVPLLAEQGYLKELDHSNILFLKNIDPLYLDLEFDPSNRYSIPWRAGTSGIAINKATVKTIPGSWAGLWNHEYSGRMIFPDDLRTTIGVVLLSLGYDVNTVNQNQLAEAKGKLAGLLPRVKLFDRLIPGLLMIQGQVELGLMYSNEAVFARQELSSILYIFPSEGAIVWQDNWVVLEESPNTDAAYAFLNYVMQADVSWMTLDDFRYTNTNTASLEYARENHPELYSAYMNSSMVNPPREVIENGHRIADVGDVTWLYDDIWVDVIVGD